MSIQPLYLSAAVGVAIGLLAAPLAVGPAALVPDRPANDHARRHRHRL